MDPVDIKALYRECYPQVARYIFKHGGSKVEAEEAFHSALLAMLNPTRAGDAVDNPGAFLFRSAWHAFLRERRYRGRSGGDDLQFNDTDPDDDDPAGTGQSAAYTEPVEPGASPDRLADQALLSATAWEEIRKLPAGQREILELTFDPELDLDEAEIADILKISRDAVKVKRSRSLALLRDRLRRRGLGFLLPPKKEMMNDE